MYESAYYNFLDQMPNSGRPSASSHQTSATLVTNDESSHHAPMSPTASYTTWSSNNSSLNQLNSLTPGASAEFSSASSSDSTSSGSSLTTKNNISQQQQIKSQQQAHEISRPLAREKRSDSLFATHSLIPTRRCSTQTTTISAASMNPSCIDTCATKTRGKTLVSLEPKPFKPFRSGSEYVEAMIEDLAEWLNKLYTDLNLTPENFFKQLETGAIICRHANNVTQFGRSFIKECRQQQQQQQQGSASSSYSSPSDELQDDSSSPDTMIKFNRCRYGSETTTGYGRNQSSYSRMSAPLSASKSHHALSLISSANKSFDNNNYISRRESFKINDQQSLTLSSPSMKPDYANIDWFKIKLLQYKKDAKSGTFFARDNICQFILWSRSLGIFDCLLFETDDLVARKNERSFILCLLEVARIGFKVGMPTPLIIQLEQEIDREIEDDAKLLICKSESIDEGSFCDDLDSSLGLSETKPQDMQPRDANKLPTEDNESALEKLKIEEEDEEKLEEIDEEQEFGPKPQVVTNDLLSLHEKVSLFFSLLACSRIRYGLARS